MSDKPTTAEGLRELIRAVVREELGTMHASGDLEGSGIDPSADVEQLAESVMTARDWKKAEKSDLSNREVIQRNYGIDVEQYPNEAALRTAIDSVKEQA
jgi:hypothetical protein